MRKKVQNVTIIHGADRRGQYAIDEWKRQGAGELPAVERGVCRRVLPYVGDRNMKLIKERVGELGG